MLKSEIRILIVDDEPSVGAALSEAFLRAGYRATHVTRPDEALGYIKVQHAHAILVDCMLPQMNGRDLAIKLRQETPETSVYLMSGIYRDKNFARDALQSTGAVAFFTKPFDLAALLQSVESRLDVQAEVEKAPFHDVLSRPQLSLKDRLYAINNSDSMSGLDLPWVYSLLMHPRMTGHLNILTADGEVIGVGFQRGNIVQVVLQDTHSYFGVLLVERGFISPIDLETAMATSTNSGAKRLGDRLVDLSVLSPHAIALIMEDQQGLRLSKTISNTSVKVNFIEAEGLLEDAQFGRHSFNESLHEWLSSKFPLDWLKAYYLPWMQWNFVKAQDWSDTHRVFNLPLMATAPDFGRELISGKTLEQLLGDADLHEASFYRRLHLLVVARLVAFGEPVQVAGDYTMTRKRLAKLNAALQLQTHFERLGVSPKAKPAEVKRAYHELAKVLHPDKLSPATPDDVRSLTRSAFAHIAQAYETLTDEGRKAEYISVLEKGNSENILEADVMAETAKLFLTQGEIAKALVIFGQAAALAPASIDLRLHLMWARMKTAGKEKDPQTIEWIQAQLASIPPEDRHSAIFLFVKGLYLKATDETASARKCFENASTVDAGFLPARRELNLLKLQSETKNADLLHGDLREVVGQLFKKRK